MGPDFLEGLGFEQSRAHLWEGLGVGPAGLGGV